MNQRVTVTASIVLAMLIASMDTTILHTTMPIIAGELGGFQFYAWAFTSYVLASTALMPIVGKLADLFGRKRLFVVGVLIFLLGSVLCGVSGTMAQLVIFRALQGLGAGIMMPLVQIIAADLYEVKDRGKIQALFTSMWMLSALLAPALGALFTEFASWRWIFYINVPVCLFSLLAIFPYRDVYEGVKAKIDGWGAMLFALGTSAILLVTAIEQYRWVWAIAGAALLIWFVIHERRHPEPMIPGRLFKQKMITWIYANNFVICLALFGLPNYVPLYLQDAGFSVLMSGLALVFMSGGWMTLSVQSGKWILRFGYRPLLLFGNGLLLAAASLLFIGQWIPGYWFLFLALIVLGAGFGLTFTVSIIGAQQLVEAGDKGISTSLQMFFRNTGLAIGVSVMGLIVNEAGTISEGVHTLFLYSLVGSLFGFSVAWRIRDHAQARTQVSNEANV